MNEKPRDDLRRAKVWRLELCVRVQAESDHFTQVNFQFLRGVAVTTISFTLLGFAGRPRKIAGRSYWSFNPFKLASDTTSLIELRLGVPLGSISTSGGAKIVSTRATEGKR